MAGRKAEAEVREWVIAVMGEGEPASEGNAAALAHELQYLENRLADDARYRGRAADLVRALVGHQGAGST